MSGGATLPALSRRSQPSADPSPLEIVALDLEGRGIARADGKVMFVDGALPGELVEYRRRQRKPKYDIADVTGLLRESSARVPPLCPHYEPCGGCSLQHLDPRAQVAIKQRMLEDNLARIGKVVPEVMLPPLHGPSWGYRMRARLSVRYVASKGGALVGFRERKAPLVVDMDSCEVLPPHVSALIAPLRELVSGMSIAARLPQIEVACGDDATVLIVRVLDAPSEADLAALRAFSAHHQLEIQLQPGGPQSIFSLSAGDAKPLSYALPEFDLKFEFGTTEFTQVNFAVNRVLVRRAVALLEPLPGERIADMFCGLGNFSLALARRGADVVGVEGSAELVDRAAKNAAANGLAQRTRFVAADLFDQPANVLREIGRLDRMLIDPPRDGAQALVHALGEDAPRRIVYVSCHPATLARDADTLVHEKGYRLLAAGVMNMFPHTAHVESIALFTRTQ